MTNHLSASLHGTRWLPGALIVLGALSGSAAAQYASYSSFGRSCANPLHVPARITGTPPVRGEIARVTVRSRRLAVGALRFAGSYFGPGVDLTSIGMTGCRSYLTTSRGLIEIPIQFRLLSSTSVAFRVPTSVPLGTRFYNQALIFYPGVNPAHVITSDAGAATVGVERPLSLAEIAAFAPLVRIHPSEAYYPMDPRDFLKVSRFRHHRTLWPDQGYNKRTRKWVTTNSKHLDYFDIPVSYVNGFRAHSNGKNRRPRDDNSGGDWNVLVESEGIQRGDRTPNGVPVFFHYRRNGLVHEVQYWWFSGYSDWHSSVGDHQGDWEHVTVRIVNRRVESIWFAAHGGGKQHPRSALRFVGTHPVVYMAKGSHASYPKAGSSGFPAYDETRDGGYQWQTWRNVQRLASQPWRDFAGAWGAVGTIAATTGPLGPWYKRNGK